MSDRIERACTNCGSLVHHEDNCTKKTPLQIEIETYCLEFDYPGTVKDHVMWGYSLASKEIDMLKIILFNYYHWNSDTDKAETDKRWQEFKTLHNL